MGGGKQVPRGLFRPVDPPLLAFSVDVAGFFQHPRCSKEWVRPYPFQHPNYFHHTKQRGRQCSKEVTRSELLHVEVSGQNVLGRLAFVPVCHSFANLVQPAAFFSLVELHPDVMSAISCTIKAGWSWYVGIWGGRRAGQ